LSLALDVDRFISKSQPQVDPLLIVTYGRAEFTIAPAD
jgi:hypothetical protein